jgi:hypothetical protein
VKQKETSKKERKKEERRKERKKERKKERERDRKKGFSINNRLLFKPTHIWLQVISV